jgi:Ca-activated chloride channel homolog
MSDLTMIVTPLRSGLIAKGHTTLDVLVQEQGPPAPLGLKVERPPLKLAIVLNRSGSMEGQPLAEAKRAAGAILERLTPLDRLALEPSIVQAVNKAGCKVQSIVPR